jgi:hypothetical protein
MSSLPPPFDHATVFKLTESPTPGWKYGEAVDNTTAGKEWLEGEKEGWKQVDPLTENPK